MNWLERLIKRPGKEQSKRILIITNSIIVPQPKFKKPPRPGIKEERD
ncbi:hypothetical protein PTK51_14745 [Clostridium perfringens]|nr:hypothetical protein [Clostridium perfringens]